MMRTKYLCLAALLTAFVAAPARAEAPKATPPAKGVVPFEVLKTGHITVKVSINGKGPYTLIFDTGAPINLLNNKIAKDAGLLKGMKRPVFSLFGSMGEAKVKELEIGGQKVTDVDAIVMDHPTVKAISDAFGPIDGIVGFPFFARFKMTMDYQAKTLTFVPNGFQPPSALKAMEGMMMALLSDPVPVVLSSPSQWGMVVSKKPDDDDPGVTVTKVVAGSPAAQAGLKEGDRLLTLDGRWTDSVADTFTAAGFVKPDTTVPVVVKRGGKEMILKVKPISGL
jgi:hypothetical protein